MGLQEFAINFFEKYFVQNVFCKKFCKIYLWMNFINLYEIIIYKKIICQLKFIKKYKNRLFLYKIL